MTCKTIFEDFGNSHKVCRILHPQAKSNGQGGMHFYAHQQIQELVFEKLKSLKNRYHGLYFGYGQRAKIEKSTFVGNGYGVETR